MAFTEQSKPKSPKLGIFDVGTFDSARFDMPYSGWDETAKPSTSGATEQAKPGVSAFTEVSKP